MQSGKLPLSKCNPARIERCSFVEKEIRFVCGLGALGGKLRVWGWACQSDYGVGNGAGRARGLTRAGHVTIVAAIRELKFPIK